MKSMTDRSLNRIAEILLWIIAVLLVAFGLWGIFMACGIGTLRVRFICLPIFAIWFGIKTACNAWELSKKIKNMTSECEE
jgi:hypothetical protein